MQKITTFLWFENEAEEAAKFYTSLFPDSEITDIQRYPEGSPLPAGTAMMVTFTLAGQQFMAMNAGEHREFGEAISLYVDCETQAEVDELWEQLTSGGGEESQCGWLRDRYGVSWQIIPSALPRLMRDPDPRRAARTMQAMLSMKKLDIAELEAAAAAA